MKSVSVPAGTFEYSVEGTGEAVLLLHGGGSTADATRPFGGPLSAKFKVIAIDWPATVRTVADVISGVLAIAGAEGLTRFSVVGFSMGGMIAQRLASEHPQRVIRQLLFVSMGPSERYATRFRRYRRILGWIPGRWLIAASAKAVTKWVAEAVRSVPKEKVEALAAHRREMFASGKVSKASLLSDADVLVDFFSTPFTPAATETMVIEAEKDRMVDETEREALKRRYAQARVLTLRGDDHFGAAVPSDALLTTLSEFLQGAAK